MSMYFCDKCGKQTHGYRVGNLVATREIRGVSIPVHYEGQVCEHCGSLLYCEDIEEGITKEAIAAYRRKTKLLAPEQVSVLIDKIGPKELAERVQCSVSEIVNSAHGGVHSAKTDAALRAILANMGEVA